MDTDAVGRPYEVVAGDRLGADAAARHAEVVDPQVMRDVLGHFASGVTVVTALTDRGPIGFTCQSFSSLSLHPPLVLFAPSRTSNTWPRLREIGRFCVNVLAEGQDELSRAFARSGTDRFAGVHWVPSPYGSPVLDDVAAWIDAQLWAEYDGGDHALVVAQVLDLGADPDRRPLLYHRGSYGLLGTEVESVRPITSAGHDVGTPEG